MARRVVRREPRFPSEFKMYLLISKKPRKLNRKKTARRRAKLASKAAHRRNRIYQRA